MDEIVVTVAEHILRLEINRPAKKNALSAAMYAAMTQALERAANDPEIRAVVISGQPDAFTSGNDINDFMQALRGLRFEETEVFRFLEALRSAPKPLVAAVRGLAVGVGTTLLLHCDLVYAGASARFQLPFVNLGLVPEAASSLLLPQVAGYRRAAELLLLGDMFDAQKARDAGIVNAVVEDDAVLGAALAAAAALAQKPPVALRLAKALMKQGSGAATQQRIREEGAYFVERLASPEAREAFAAFLERRKPDFSRFA